MSQVTIFLAPVSIAHQFYFTQDQDALAYANIHLYKEAASFFTNLDDEKAAEEAFDLTNNPNRQEERGRLYGRGRSVSVGDVVQVNRAMYLCKSCGWERI